MIIDFHLKNSYTPRLCVCLSLINGNYNSRTDKTNCFFFFVSIFQQHVDKYGINKCIEMAMDHIDPKNDRDYHISFDIDALDRHEAPSTGIARKYFYFRFTLFVV